MSSELLMKNSLVIFIILFVAVVSFSAEERPSLNEIQILSQALNDRTNGNNPFYNKALSPAQSLEINKNKSARIETVNSQIMNELSLVIGTFKNAPEDQKNEAVYSVVSKIEPELLKNNGAYITFFDTNPSAAISRTLLLISKKAKPEITAAQVFNILSSYKRSAKQSEFVYEYENSQNLTAGLVKAIQGSDNSWKGAEAAAPFQLSEDHVLKKCRQLLGWRCVTSLYRSDSYLTANDEIKLLFISVYDLQNNLDNSVFAKDKRSTNQITGSTAMYVVKESSDWIMLYGVDTQWNNGKLSFQGPIQSEFKKDFERFKDRISFDLNTTL